MSLTDTVCENSLSKWGVLGCADIVIKNLRAVTLSPNCKLVAIASRTKEKVQSFAKENRLSSDIELYDNYEALLADKNVQCVYIPLPTTLHLEWAVKTANAGKHVLLEKPAAVNVSELKIIFEACKKNEVMFMDGVMFMHNDRLQLLRDTLRDPYLGEIRRINSSFSIKASPEFLQNNIRVKSDGDPLGVLGDLSWYSFRLAMIVFSYGDDLNGYNTRSKSSRVVFPSRISVNCNVWSQDLTVPLDVDGKLYFGESRDYAGGMQPVMHFDNSFLLPFR